MLYGAMNFPIRPFLDELEENQLVIKVDGKYEIFSSAFKKFIQDVPFFG